MNGGLCAHHSSGGNDWPRDNRTMCDFIHRGIVVSAGRGSNATFTSLGDLTDSLTSRREEGTITTLHLPLGRMALCLPDVRGRGPLPRSACGRMTTLIALVVALLLATVNSPAMA